MPRLSDKHIAAIRAAAEDNDHTYGFGDVILLCHELQERRADTVPARDLAKVSATDLLKEVTTCVIGNEPLVDADVRALFHALQNRDYFQTTCLVDRKSLKSLLHALSSPEQPHLIREMQVTRGLPKADGPINPIDQLIVDLQRANHASA